MRGVGDKWIAIGLFLGVQYKDIRYFDDDEDRLEDRITKMVNAWLERKYDVEAYGAPSWRKLTQAIAARSGGSHFHLASMISQEHPIGEYNDILTGVNEKMAAMMAEKMDCDQIQQPEKPSRLNKIVYLYPGMLQVYSGTPQYRHFAD